MDRVSRHEFKTQFVKLIVKVILSLQGNLMREKPLASVFLFNKLVEPIKFIKSLLNLFSVLTSSMQSLIFIFLLLIAKNC